MYAFIILCVCVSVHPSIHPFCNSGTEILQTHLTKVSERQCDQLSIGNLFCYFLFLCMNYIKLTYNEKLMSVHHVP